MNPQTYIIYTVSRKFKYLKKTVYKKCDEINLFDHSTRDITERNSFIINVLLSACLLFQTDGSRWDSLLSRPKYGFLPPSIQFVHCWRSMTAFPNLSIVGHHYQTYDSAETKQMASRDIQ